MSRRTQAVEVHTMHCLGSKGTASVDKRLVTSQSYLDSACDHLHFCRRDLDIGASNAQVHYLSADTALI